MLLVESVIFYLILLFKNYIMALQNTNPSTTNAWQNLSNHFSKMEGNSIKEMFQKDAARAEKFHIQWNDF